MTLQQWLSEERLRPHQTTAAEIQALLTLAERDLKNAKVKDVDADWRFNMAYSAALSLATIPLLCAGYKTAASKGGHHYVTLSSLTETMGTAQKKRANYLNACRSK